MRQAPPVSASGSLGPDSITSSEVRDGGSNAFPHSPKTASETSGSAAPVGSSPGSVGWVVSSVGSSLDGASLDGASSDGVGLACVVGSVAGSG